MKKLFRRLAAALIALSLCTAAALALSVEQALPLLEQYYVDPLPDAAYEAKNLAELFDAIGDPYTYYMSAAQYDAFERSLEQESSVTGIGATIVYTDEGVRITSLLDGGSAKDAGLAVGDLIVAVDGVSCVPAGEAQRALILGEEGTFVTLTVRREDGTVKDYRIERRTVAIHNTKIRVDGETGVIDCDSFGSQTADYFTEGIGENDEAVTRWLVDLRGNPGGYADGAVSALGALTGAGIKLYYRLADGTSIYTLYLEDALTDKPVITLVDGDSASASEIFASGIRADQAGVVIGSRTYGKGTAQIVLDEDDYPDLFDGDVLKVTAYRFYSGDHNTTDRIGVLPTLLVGDGYTSAVAALLSARASASGEDLELTLNGQTFYVDPDAARDSLGGKALFSALAPDVSITRVFDGASLDPATAAAYCGVDYVSRGFSDVAESPYAAQIETLAVYGLVNGDGTGRFLPERTLTRAELATMLCNALNVTALRSAGFSDVDENSWYASSVNAMAFLGFMQGVGGGNFDPNGSLTQEQLVTVLGRLARFLNFDADDYALALTDEELAPFAALHDWARVAASVLTVYDGNLLYADLSDVSPDAPATREQAAATLCNILKDFNILSY